MWKLTNKTINPGLARYILRGYASPVYSRTGARRTVKNSSPGEAQAEVETAPAGTSAKAAPAKTTYTKSAPVADASSSLSLGDAPPTTVTQTGAIDWSDSFHGLGAAPFSPEICKILLAPVNSDDIELKDNLLYLPEIKYRRILNLAFGPGGWGLAPRTETLIIGNQVSREYGLICHGRLISVARGEQDYFGGQEKVTTALEGCKSNALMRCCKDLGIASELWDPSFVKNWIAKNCEEVWAEHITKKTKKKILVLKRNSKLPLAYPYKSI